MKSASSDQLTVIFDGTCGFCTATKTLLGKLDHDNRLTWIPCQHLSGDDEPARLCQTSVVAIDNDGQITIGPQAFASIAGMLVGSAIPLRIATLPGIRTMLGLGYHGISLIRSRIPGVSPWCDQHPEDCRPAVHDR
jgi:predicted DCC family thiol-disulfide oxidoreductase YuxK